MEEPRQRNRPSLRIVLVLHRGLILSQRAQDVHRSGPLVCTLAELSIRLKGPINVVPRSTVVLPVRSTKFIGPPGRLHEQHHVAVPHESRNAAGGGHFTALCQRVPTLCRRKRISVAC
jgi:hypothetical protein